MSGQERRRPSSPAAQLLSRLSQSRSLPNIGLSLEDAVQSPMHDVRGKHKPETSESHQTDHSSDGNCRHQISRTRNQTINAHFMINSSRNGGLDFQFDSVERGRAERRRLQGGDCDCCRDYYEVAEPVSVGLQAPLWRSPSPVALTMPSALAETAETAESMNADRRLAQDKRRNIISRHRHQWTPPSTPPDYWKIGFPTTQEAAAINRRADDMHEDKRRRVEREGKA